MGRSEDMRSVEKRQPARGGLSGIWNLETRPFDVFAAFFVWWLRRIGRTN